jgi:hypothetical protein
LFLRNSFLRMCLRNYQGERRMLRKACAVCVPAEINAPSKGRSVFYVAGAKEFLRRSAPGAPYAHCAYIPADCPSALCIARSKPAEKPQGAGTLTLLRVA